MRCMTVGLWPSGIFFHFTILFTCYSFSDSLLLSYEDLGPFFTVLAPFSFICFPFLGRSRLPALRSEISWLSDLSVFSRLDAPSIRKRPDRPPSLSRITGAKRQSRCRAPCLFRKQALPDAADLVG